MTDQTLDTLRQEIDEIDATLMQTLAARMKTMKKIDEYKKEHHIPPIDLERWRAVLESKIALAKELGMDHSMVRDIYNRIHEAALQRAAGHR